MRGTHPLSCKHRHGMSSLGWPRNNLALTGARSKSGPALAPSAPCSPAVSDASDSTTSAASGSALPAVPPSPSTPPAPALGGAADATRASADSDLVDAVYARVSTRKQLDDLGTQLCDLQRRHPGARVFSDVGSGLNFKRKGLLSLLELAFEGRLRSVHVAHKDRLCRFAFDLLEHVLRRHGAQIVVDAHDGDAAAASPELELARGRACRRHRFWRSPLRQAQRRQPAQAQARRRRRRRRCRGSGRGRRPRRKLHPRSRRSRRRWSRSARRRQASASGPWMGSCGPSRCAWS